MRRRQLFRSWMCLALSLCAALVLGTELSPSIVGYGVGSASSLESEVLFQDDFNDGNADGWLEVSGAWEVIDQEYVIALSGYEVPAYSIAGDPGWSDYTYEVDVMGTAGVDKSIVFRYVDEDNYYVVNLRSGGYQDLHLWKWVDGVGQSLAQAPFSNWLDMWYRLEVRVQGETIQVYVDGELLISYSDVGTSLAMGRIGVHGWTGGTGTDEVHYDNVLVLGESAYSISGHVEDALGSPIPDVTITAGGYSAITDADGDYTITGVPSGIYTLTASKLGYAFSPMALTVTLPPDASDQDFTGLPPDLGFTPNPDGYSFENWGSEPKATWEDFRAVYGSENIELCNAAGKCRPTMTANTYFRRHFRPASWHCYGMSVTSLRFFAGLASPSDLDPSASATYDLSRSDQVDHHIGQYQRYQFAQNIARRIYDKRTNSTPNTVLLELSAGLLPGNLDPLALVLVNNDGTSAHAVVPYRASDRGNGIWWIYVYDNEDPGGTDRYVEFNTNDNSWNYVIEKFWWFEFRTWSGDADDFHIFAIELRLHEEPRVPPWNSDVVPLLPIAGVLSLGGSGDLLVVDQYGNRLGFVNDQLVNEIPDAFPIVPMVGSFNDGRSPESYSIPISTTYSISLTGESIAESGIGTLTLFAPDRSLTLDSLATGATSNDSIVFNEQLSGFTYETMDSTKLFSFTMTYEHPSAYSERFAVTDSAVDNGGIIAIEVITATESLVYFNSGASAKSYDLGIDLASVEGVDSFRHQGLEVLGGGTHIIDYANWPTNDYVTLYIDHESNGTVDETIVLKNKINRVYLPLVLRGLP